MVRKAIIISMLFILPGIFFSCGEEEVEKNANIFTESGQWDTPTNGLPDENYEFNGLASWQGKVVASLKVQDGPGGVYEYNGGGFTKLADLPTKYGIGNLEVTTDGRLITLKQGNLYELQGNEGNYQWQNIELEKDFSRINQFIAGQEGHVVLHTNGTTNPAIYRMNPANGSLENLNFPFSGLDGKPHVSLHQTPTGEIWYKSNYSGIFRYADGNWEKAHDKSGAITIAADGTVYFSTEVKKYTQISTFFKYTDDGEWKQVQTHKGYGIGGVPIGDDNHIAALSGRFGQFIISRDKKWILPDFKADVNLPEDNSKGVSARHALEHQGTLYVVQELGIDDVNPRFMTYTPDTTNLPYYTSNVELNTGTYLTSGGNAEAVGTGILPDGRIAVALNADPAQLGANTTMLSTASESARGVVAILAPDASAVTKVFTVDEKLYDLDVATGANSIAVAGQNHYGMLDPASGAWAWSEAYNSDKKRVGTNPNGQLAVIVANEKIRLHGNGGEQLFEKEHKRSYTEDIEISEDGNTYYLVGFDNKDLPGGNPVQVAFLSAYTQQGDMEWQRFGFNGENLNNNIADTRMYRVKMGQDGFLHILGESAGSQTVFRYDGESYSGDEVVKEFDLFNALWNTASAHIAYHARFNAESGKHVHSQLTMSRLSGGKSNTFRVGDITADQEGSVYINGSNAYRFANRPAQRINGQYVGEYNGDPSFLAISPEYTNRHAWTSFSEDKGAGKGVAIATNNQKIVSVYNTTEGKLFTTPNALQSHKGEGVYVAVIPVGDNIKR